MTIIRPFPALRPTPEAAPRVASVPYDVLSADEARALAAGNPDSYLHVIRPEIDLPPDADPHADSTHRRGRESLDGLRARGLLVEEAKPCLYLYRLVMGDHVQTGVVGAYSVEEYDGGLIVKHEHTRPDKEDDRTRHILTLGAQAGPVFLTHRPSGELDALAASARAEEPLFDFEAEDGVRHTVWRLEETGPWTDAFAALDRIYVADGHHRSAAASNVRRILAARGPLGPDDPARSFLGVSFPADQVQILPYNRVVSDLGGRTPDAFLAAVQGAATLQADAGPEPEGPGDVRMVLGGRWYGLTLEPTADDPVSRLAVQRLQDRILGPLLGIEDPRTDPRIAFVGGSRGWQELSKRVETCEAAVGFSLPAVEMDQLLEVSDAGRTMPPKSTWFEPKLRSGLFTYLLQTRVGAEA